MPFARWVAAAVAMAAGFSLGASGIVARAASPPLSVTLTVSTRHARQLVGITLVAHPSRAGEYAYFFQYGDGIVEAEQQPIASHGYAHPGTYRARVAIIDASGDRAISPAVAIHVRYGLPPRVRITTPAPGGVLTLRPHGARIAGIATDPTGIRAVQVAIQLLQSRQHYVTGGRCLWVDAQSRLVLSGCQTPVFFAVAHAAGRWQAVIGAGAPLPAGIYAVRVRAIDRVGNISTAIYERLRTIVPFRLVP